MLLWASGAAPQRLEVPVGPSVLGALRRLRVASWAWLVLAVLALLLTGKVALALAPAVSYAAFRAYTLRRYWIRCTARDAEQLELRDVSEGFKSHVDDEGRSSWAFRTTPNLNDEELLGALTVRTDVLRRELLDAYE